jgi:hypothetical protein
VASTVLIGAVLWLLLPKGSFSNDLTRVGQGQPALVMLREVHVMGGDLVMEQMLLIQAEFQDSVEFLVVHTGHPDGEAFAAEHNISDGSLVLFDAEGQVLGRSARPESADALRQFITELL